MTEDSETTGYVRLAQHEGQKKLIARSEAKRLIAPYDRLKAVVLDFEGVEQIGQGFADEVFRVFQLAHPGTELIPIHVQPDVEAMIKHVLIAGARTSAGRRPAGAEGHGELNRGGKR